MPENFRDINAYLNNPPPPVEQAIDPNAHCYVCHTSYDIDNREEHRACEGVTFGECNSLCPLWAIEHNPIRRRIERVENNSTGSGFWSESIPNVLDHEFDIDNSWYIPKIKKQKSNIKTPEQKYKEFKKSITECKKEDFDQIMKFYIAEREEKLIRDMLEESKHLRTCHDLRCFINDYIYRNL